jgi:lipopolysaccharide transport system ATP-binding protein
MSSPIIQVENLSKQYRLGAIGSKTLRDDLKRWWYRTRGRENPFLKIGETNDRTRSGFSEYVWALQEVSFEVQPGQVLGIIGRNGAGKSTLLKILSRVTEPTTGCVTMNGRVASLLEVGTGFHPELTGRENIYLNGAILGMTRREINRKFDEIVDFAAVARYIDTPVKRYSSGMYVRLAFAVAAHLEPEILVVDEVLAVGDAEFQKKALGRMEAVSRTEGRTVLYVSHNLPTLQNFCDQCLLLENGRLHSQGPTDQIIKNYLTHSAGNTLQGRPVTRKGTGEVQVADIAFVPPGGRAGDPVRSGSPMDIVVALDYSRYTGRSLDLQLDLRIDDQNGNRIFWVSNTVKGVRLNQSEQVRFSIEKLPLLAGTYYVSVMLRDGQMALDWIQHGITFDVAEGDYFGTGRLVPPGQALSLHPFEVYAS